MLELTHDPSELVLTIGASALTGAFVSTLFFGRGIRSIERKLDTIHQSLFGVDGTNGMNSKMIRHGKRLSKIEQFMVELAVRNNIEAPDFSATEN